jgi:thymidylate synthase
MRHLIGAIRAQGIRINATRGDNTELTGVLVELTNPRARISLTETRGKLFSCLGELFWYLSKGNAADFITYYIEQYAEEAVDGAVYGGYGPRLFSQRDHDQVQGVMDLLRAKPSTRRAVIQLFNAEDLNDAHKEVPCTCTLQFLIRDGRLDLIVTMRSNDVFLGFPHDVFCFTMIQEIVACSLGVELGNYKHFVGSLHLYEKHSVQVDEFLGEGWQATDQAMPSMPSGDPWSSIATVLGAESSLRTSGILGQDVRSLDPYWMDLVRLFEIYTLLRNQDAVKAKLVSRTMTSSAFDAIIRTRIDGIRL